MLDPVGSFSMQMPDPVKKKLFVQSPPSTLLTTKRKQDVRSHSTAQDRKKLFVGMAPKSAYEEDYRSVFTPFGSITDIYVIRDRNGFSKGCAFVKYELVKDARNAIEALHDKYIMPGGFRTLVVSVADERRSPQASTGHEMGGGSGECVRAPAQSLFLMDGDGGGHGDGTARMRERMAPDSHVSCVGGPQAAARALSAATASIPVLPDMQQLFCGGNPPQGTYVFYPHVPPSSSTTASRSQYLKHAEDMDAGGSFSPQIFTVGLSGRVECHNQCNAQSTTATNVSLAAGVVAAQSKHVQDYENELREDEHGAGGGGGLAARDLGVIGPDEKSRRWAKQAVGPTGANLFVYYLPGSLSDADLATAFAPFGELLSAKVYYDRDTGESKGFGATCTVYHRVLNMSRPDVWTWFAATKVLIVVVCVGFFRDVICRRRKIGRRPIT